MTLRTVVRVKTVHILNGLGSRNTFVDFKQRRGQFTVVMITIKITVEDYYGLTVPILSLDNVFLAPLFLVV